jgi:hypothetical protein
MRMRFIIDVSSPYLIRFVTLNNIKNIKAKLHYQLFILFICNILVLYICFCHILVFYLLKCAHLNPFYQFLILKTVNARMRELISPSPVREKVKSFMTIQIKLMGSDRKRELVELLHMIPLLVFIFYF